MPLTEKDVDTLLDGLVPAIKQYVEQLLLERRVEQAVERDGLIARIFALEQLEKQRQP